MAKLAASFSVLLFLFVLSYARNPGDIPLKDFVSSDPLLEPKTNPATAKTILLPSENPDSEAATVIEWEPESSNSKNFELDAGLESLEASTESSEASKSVPLTVISFRPINRQIPRRSLPLWVRRGHRCHRIHNSKPWGPRLPRREIPYGNDMIMKDGEDRGFDKFDPMFRDGVRQIPARWEKFRHGGPRFSFVHDMERKEDNEKGHHHHHHHHHHDHEEGWEFERVEHHHGGGGGFLKRIRKFLTHF
ncbi:Myb-related protein like [Quillaja saponaria]|uniref:Myb-related protein like n=1 Tax=Quillaja saponaria TaxID=32244 RepID=A0AAD7KS36_QUISA|nr:Myb-related protein like [Quillaja saponaria]